MDDQNTSSSNIIAGIPKVNMLANLLNWVARVRKDISPAQIPLFLEVYGLSGYLSPELKEVIVHLAEMWKEQPRRGVPFEEAYVHATANLLHSASVWGIRRLIFVSVPGAHPGDPDPYFDARGRAEALARGSELSWTVFRPSPWFDLRDGSPRVSTNYLEELAGAIAESVRRQDTVGRVYEGASPDRFPWRELSQLSGHPPPVL